MAKIVSDRNEWYCSVRCAQPRNGRVDGCFSLIEITAQDIKGQSSGTYERLWVVCPVCKDEIGIGIEQVGSGILQLVRQRIPHYSSDL